jgi:hypothetical protein
MKLLRWINNQAFSNGSCSGSTGISAKSALCFAGHLVCLARGHVYLPALCRASCLTGSLVVLIFNTVHASGPGTGAANFLKIPVGAMETSLGGAFTAVADNANAVYYNPAGLGFLQNSEISFSQNNFIEGMSQQWLAAAYPYKSGAFGFGVNYLSVSAFDAYDNNDTPTGSVSAYDMAVYLSWGGRLPLDNNILRTVSYGAGAKYISGKLDTDSGTGYGLDLGLIAATAIKHLRFGVNIANAASTRIKFIKTGGKLPLTCKGGAMYELRTSAISAARFTLDYIFLSDRIGYIAVGMEHSLYDIFAVRIGNSSYSDISNGLNLGLGFNLSKYVGRNISVDYSYGATYAFGDIHKLGVTYKFGSPVSDRRTGLKETIKKTQPAITAALIEPDAGVPEDEQ